MSLYALSHVVYTNTAGHFKFIGDVKQTVRLLLFSGRRKEGGLER